MTLYDGHMKAEKYKLRGAVKSRVGIEMKCNSGVRTYIWRRENISGVEDNFGLVQGKSMGSAFLAPNMVCH